MSTAVVSNSRTENAASSSPAAVQKPPRLLWLDLTRKYQLRCVHCYNGSGADGTHGTMTRSDWINVLDEGAALGVPHVQFIGGEPTLHPDFDTLVTHALGLGMQTEVYSNLVHVPSARWELFRRNGLSLATSYYSAKANAHDAMTGRPSHRRTRANIEKAVQLGIPLRTGIVAETDEQIAEARRDLEMLGVKQIGADRVRPFGRGAQGKAPDLTGLCGNCGNGAAAIGPDGAVSPCVFSTWIKTGNVRDAPLGEVLTGSGMAEAATAIRNARGAKECQPDCVPNNPCDPRCEPAAACTPGTPPSDCDPRR
ncbi:radical SAM protein [Streptomyces sp. NRRL F-5755]|uniref:radical SAM protein n=1 Tax=Streptomyces sp. NRRL F-5755 TaxID=1519475 RepID=UPI00099C9597|nr:radical SAM protein [Streptomyces sp. NRRL F-5755]